MAGIADLFREARRRRVFRVLGIYIVAAWVTVQVASESLPAFAVEAEAIRYVWLAVLLGFPLAIVFGWLYDLTPTGISRTPPAGAGDDVDLGLRRTDYLVLAALGLVAVGIIAELAGRMGAIQVAATDPDPMSIAVLPLDNLSGDPDQAYFVAGMQDALISALSRVSGFRVTSRTSTLVFRDSGKPVAQVARELGVSKIVEGSVYRVGDTVRVIVQLIDAENDEHLWDAEYERKVSDLLRLQSDITRAIASEIRVALTQAESQRLAGVGSVDPAAYEAYLQGKFHAEQFTPRDLEMAAEWYQRAVDLDPENALPHYGLTRLCRFQLQAGLVPPREGEPRCRESLMRALELDDTLAEVHLGLALSFWVYDYNWPAAEQSFERALELNPSYVEARMFYSHFLGQMGRTGESTRQIRKARELDPLNGFVKGMYGAQQAVIGNDETGIALIEEALREMPGLGFGYDVLWFANARLGRLQPSVDAAIRHFGVTMGKETIAAAIGAAYTTGNFAAAMAAGAAAAEQLAKRTYVPALEIAALWGLAGEPDKAFEWLDRAYDQHDPSMPYLGAPFYFGTAEADPRFALALRRMNLERTTNATSGSERQGQ